MNFKISHSIVISHLLTLTCYSSIVLADLQSDSNLIFNWAEQQYSDVLSPPSNTQTTQFQDHSWYYRYYAQSNLYLAINENQQVYIYDGNTGSLNYINQTSVYLSQINQSDEQNNESESDNNDTGTTNTQPEGTEVSEDSNCQNYLNAFTNVTTLVDTSCNDEQLNISSSTGLPALQNQTGDDQVMVSITDWINRVPIPYEYNWQIPTAPSWQSNLIEATAKGPIAVTVNGVPIFHYERRPDVSTALSNYASENDTVVQGELDHCGGHSGQGDDYHYHYTPVCLLDEHDLAQPIAFGLDGAPVYYGEGGTDYYGWGKYNDWNNFPDNIDLSNLDECNAYQKDDGSYIHYTTKQPPYVIGCHHAFFDSSLQIEPRPMDGREQGLATPLGGEYGEPVNTLVTAFKLNDDGSYQMEFNNLTNSSQTSSVIYRKSSTGENCWEFEFRKNKDQTGEVQVACRNNSTQSPAPSNSAPATNSRIFPIHNHSH